MPLSRTIRGSNAVRLVKDMELTVRIENKEDSMTTHLWVFNDLTENVDMLRTTKSRSLITVFMCEILREKTNK